MRYKLLSVFLAIQLVSFTLWSTVFSDNTDSIKEEFLPVAQDQTVIHSTLELASASIVEPPLDELVRLEIPKVEIPLEQEDKVIKNEVESEYLPHFSARNMSEEQGLINPIHQNQIEETLNQLPLAHAQTLETVTLDYNPEAHRGLGGGAIIILRAVNMTPEEFVAVFIHELGHNVDYGLLQNTDSSNASGFKDGEMTLYETDPSLDFYRLSWMSNYQHKPGINDSDFVSGYATSDPFEDFAETYAFYVLHNQEFQKLASSSTILSEKYNFMRDVVFGGQIFNIGENPLNLEERPWDVTVLPYNLSTFLDERF